MGVIFCLKSALVMERFKTMSSNGLFLAIIIRKRGTNLNTGFQSLQNV